jgi:hypothetical protein
MFMWTLDAIVSLLADTHTCRLGLGRMKTIHADSKPNSTKQPLKPMYSAKALAPSCELKQKENLARIPVNVKDKPRAIPAVLYMGNEGRP